MRAKLLLAFVLLSTAISANAMSAQTFYAKALVLQRQGYTAIFSSDYHALKAEIEVAAKSVKAENDAAKAKGKALYCPPAKVKIDADKVIREFGAIPVSRRKQITVRAAWREIAIRKYPC
jgi:hypothetical protein